MRTTTPKIEKYLLTIDKKRHVVLKGTSYLFLKSRLHLRTHRPSNKKHMLNYRHVVLFSTVNLLSFANKMQLLVKIQGAIVDTPVFQVIIQDAIKNIKQKCRPAE